MSNNTLTVTEVVNSVTVTPVNNTVEITTGISAGSTTTAGILQLTDSTSSTSTTTAATPNAVKTAYDFADTKLLKYATQWQVKYRSGYFYEPQIGCTITTSTYTINRLFYVPFFLQESITMDRIGAECTSAIASSTFRLGLYSSDSDGLPSNLVFDAGTIDTSSPGLKTITISQSVSAGFYFLSYAQQGGATNATMRALIGTSGNWSPVAGTTMAGSNHFTSYSEDTISGAFPSTATPGNANTLNPMRMQFRVA